MGEQASVYGEAGRSAVRPEEDWYRRLVEQSPDGICVYTDGRVVFVNSAGVRMAGAADSAELMGRLITDFVTAESIPPMLADLRRLRHPGDSTAQFAAEMIRVDGSLLPVEVVAVKLSWHGADALQVITRDVITRDVSARKAAETALRYQAALVNHVSDAIIGTTADGIVTSWNPAAESIYGRAEAETIGLPITTVLGSALGPAAIIAAGGVVHAQHRATDGQLLDVRVSAAAMADGYVLVCCDLTALHQAEQHFEAVVASMTEGLIVTDKDGVITSVNPAGCRIMGATDRAELIGVSFLDATDSYPFYDDDGRNIPPENRPVHTVLRTGEPWVNVVNGWDGPAGRRWLMSSVRLLKPDRPGQSDMLITFTDITAQRTEAQEMKYLATHDGLTSLPNRAAVLHRINDALTNHDADIGLRAVLFIDVDDLKSTNDTHGHDAGDHVLRETAQRLCHTVADGDLVGRWGGDEFVILICRPITSMMLTDLVGAIHTALAKPTRIAGTSVAIGASIGVVEVNPTEARTAEEILRAADQAMYDAKRARR